MMRKLWAVAAAAALAACAAGRAEKTSMTIHEWKGQRAGPGEPGSLVAGDQGAWDSAWRRVGQDAPALDFSRFIGVMVFAGEKPTGGYAVVFDEPLRRGDDVVVRYRVPKPKGFATQELTRPWTALALPRPNGRVIVEAAHE